MNLTIDNTICLVIDIQSKLVPHIFENEALIEANARLIKGLKLLGMPIIVTEQYPKGLGFTDESLQNALGDDYKPLLKDTFSCMRNDEILAAIKSHNKKNIIVVGIEAHICVMQTVVDMLAMDFKPLVVANCIGSRTMVDKKYGIKRMLAEGASVGTYESVLMELTVGSFNTKFKEISNIIK